MLFYYLILSTDTQDNFVKILYIKKMMIEMNFIWGLFVLVVLANAFPQFVEEFKIDDSPMRLRYDPYNETWLQFKIMHGEC